METTPQKVNPNPTPKARFQAGTGNISFHRHMMEDPAFDRAVDFATLEYVRLLAGGITDTSSAMAAGCKLQGVIEFQGQLKNLAETPMPLPARKDSDNLSVVPLPKR